MTFADLRILIKKYVEKNKFEQASKLLEQTIFSISRQDCISLLLEVGIIPEDIVHDSSEEKLYSKVTDMLLAKSFQELGFSSSVIKERTNCADVSVRSRFHNYSFVADAKAFRLSRTAKNQKDFKVSSLSEWRGNNDFAVLICPYYQYPAQKSQIYKQAIEKNVCLLSWEFLAFLLSISFEETDIESLRLLWNVSNLIAEQTKCTESDQCFFNKQFEIISLTYSAIDIPTFNDFLTNFKNQLLLRADAGVNYWNKRIEAIEAYSRKQAIEELMRSLKLKNKINTIKKFIQSLS